MGHYSSKFQLSNWVLCLRWLPSVVPKIDPTFRISLKCANSKYGILEVEKCEKKKHNSPTSYFFRALICNMGVRTFSSKLCKIGSPNRNFFEIPISRHFQHSKWFKSPSIYSVKYKQVEKCEPKCLLAVIYSFIHVLQGRTLHENA